MSIITQIRDSVYGPEFYKELRSQGMGYSFKYYFKFALLLALLGATVISIRLIPHMRGFSSGVSEAILSNYPTELVITIKDHKASTNIQEPYYVPLPASDWSEGGTASGDKLPTNVLVIDTKTPFSLEQYQAYDSVAWLMQDSIVIKDDEAGVRLIPLSDVPDVVINKGKIEDWSGVIGGVLKVVSYFVPVIIFIGLFLFMLWNLVYLIFGACLIWLASKLAGWGLTYGQSYRVGMHAFTLPIIVFGLLTLGNI